MGADRRLRRSIERKRRIEACREWERKRAEEVEAMRKRAEELTDRDRMALQAQIRRPVNTIVSTGGFVEVTPGGFLLYGWGADNAD